MDGKIQKSFSVTQQTSYTSKPSYLLNQGTKKMDVIVQVKFFVVVVVVVVFLSHLKLFAIVSEVTCHVLKSFFTENYIL